MTTTFVCPHTVGGSVAVTDCCCGDPNCKSVNYGTLVNLTWTQGQTDRAFMLMMVLQAQPPASLVPLIQSPRRAFFGMN